jgi:hypothetical protein
MINPRHLRNEIEIVVIQQVRQDAWTSLCQDMDNLSTGYDHIEQGSSQARPPAARWHRKKGDRPERDDV